MNVFNEEGLGFKNRRHTKAEIEPFFKKEIRKILREVFKPYIIEGTYVIDSEGKHKNQYYIGIGADIKDLTENRAQLSSTLQFLENEKNVFRVNLFLKKSDFEDAKIKIQDKIDELGIETVTIEDYNGYYDGSGYIVSFKKSMEDFLNSSNQNKELQDWFLEVSEKMRQIMKEHNWKRK